MTTGETIGELYRKRIIEPLSLEGTSSPDLADNSLPEQHAKSYSFFGQSSGSDPIDATGWSPSVSWIANEMISTVEDLLAYGRALGTEEGLLSPVQQAERLSSFLTDLPPFDQPPITVTWATASGSLAIVGGSVITASCPVTLPISPNIRTSMPW